MCTASLMFLVPAARIPPFRPAPSAIGTASCLLLVMRCRELFICSGLMRRREAITLKNVPSRPSRAAKADFCLLGATNRLWTMLRVRNWEVLTRRCGCTQGENAARMKVLASRAFVSNDPWRPAPTERRRGGQSVLGCCLNMDWIPSRTSPLSVISAAPISVLNCSRLVAPIITEVMNGFVRQKAMAI